jgi:hypothetical protein
MKNGDFITKNTKRIFCYILILLCFMKLSYGQSDSVSLNAKNKIVLKWTPTAMIGYSALQFAGEFFYNPQKSVQIEYGLILPMSSGRDNNKGHRIRIEQRNYINKRENFYFSPEIHFTSVRYKLAETFSNNWAIDSITGERYAIDEYLEYIGINKYAFSFNFKTGIQYIFKKPKLVFDVYAGIGVRYIVTRFTSYPTTGELVPPKDTFFDGYDSKESNRFAPNGVIGIKLGYQIR